MRLYEIEDVEDKSRQKFRRKVLEKVIARAPTLKALKGPAQRISATDAKAKRRQLLTEACTEAGITDMEHDAIFSQFIRTGRGGKKSIPELIQNHLQKGVRRVTLINALAVEHLELRYDSKLCEAYISEGQGTLESIVSTMVDMHIVSISLFCSAQLSSSFIAFYRYTNIRSSMPYLKTPELIIIKKLKKIVLLELENGFNSITKRLEGIVKEKHWDYSNEPKPFYPLSIRKYVTVEDDYWQIILLITW